MIANEYDLILDMTRYNTEGIPDGPNLGVDCGDDG